MADLGQNFSLQDAMTDGPAEIESEVKQDFITSLENEKFDDEVGETCDKSNYVPLLDDDDVKEPKNKSERSAAPHDSIMENGEHNLGENEVTDPFGSNYDENVLSDLPPFDTTNQPALSEHFEAERTVPAEELNPFEEGWLTDSNSKTDSPSGDISEITTDKLGCIISATCGDTPSDSSIQVPLPLTQSDNMAGIWQPTAEEQLALSPHQPAEPLRSSEEATLLLPEGQASFDAYLQEGSRDFLSHDQEKLECGGAAELISCISFDAPLDPYAEPLPGHEFPHESEEHAKESNIVEPADSTVNEDSPEYLSVDAQNAQLVEQIDEAALLLAEGQLNEVGQPEDTANNPVVEERDREGSTTNEELLDSEEVEHQTAETPSEKLDLVLEECKSDTSTPHGGDTPSEQELILEEENQNYEAQLPCEDFLPSKTEDKDLLQYKTEDEDLSPLKTEGQDLLPLITEDEVLNPATPEAEVLTSHIPEAEVLTSPIPEAEVLTSPIPEAEVLTSHIPEAEVLTSPIPEAEVLTSPIPEAEVLTSPIPEAEVLTSPIPEAEVLTSPIPEVEVLFAPIPEAEVLSAPIPEEDVLSAPISEVEVLSAPIPEAEYFSAPTPEVEYFSAPTREAEVLSAPIPEAELLSPITPEAEVLSNPKTDLLDENITENLLVPEDIPAQQAVLHFEEALLQQTSSEGSPVEEQSSVVETAPEKNDEHKAVPHVEFPQDIQASLRRGYKTSERRFGRTKTVVPVTGDLTEPHLDRQSAESRGILASRAKDLHKKAHDLMENRQEALKDGGEMDSAQALMKKKKKKPRQKKYTQTRVSEFFKEDDFDLNIRDQTELQVSGSEPMGQQKTVRRKHFIREVEQNNDPLMFATNQTCSSTREAIEMGANAEVSLPVQCFTNQEQDPQNMGTIVNPYKIAESPYMALGTVLKDSTPLENWENILHEPEKSLDQMEANVTLADKVLTKCPYLKHVLKEVKQPEHSDTYTSKTDTNTTTCPSTDLPEGPILVADLAKSQLEADKLFSVKTKKADGTLNDNWISGPSKDFKPVHNIPEIGGSKPISICKKEQASRKDKPSDEKSVMTTDEKEPHKDTRHEAVTAVDTMTEQDQRNNNTERTQSKQPDSSEGQAVKSESRSQTLGVQVFPKEVPGSNFTCVDHFPELNNNNPINQGLDTGIIPRPLHLAKGDKPKRENERRKRSSHSFSESVVNADVAEPESKDSIVVVDSTSSQSLAPKETIFEPLTIIEKETIALEQPSPITFEVADNPCLGEDTSLFQRQIKNKRGKAKTKAEIKASEGTDGGLHLYSEPATMFEGGGIRKPKETVSPVSRSERGSLKRTHGAEKTKSSVLPEMVGNQKTPEAGVVQSNVVDSPADSLVTPSKEIMAIVDNAVKEKERDTWLAESLNVKPDLFTTFPKDQDIDQKCKPNKSKNSDLPKHLNDDILILTAASADITINDKVTPEIKEKSTAQIGLKTLVDKPEKIDSLVTHSLENIDSKDEKPKLSQEKKIQGHCKTAHRIYMENIDSLVTHSLEKIDSKDEIPKLSEEKKIQGHHKTAHLIEVPVIVYPDGKCKTSELKEHNHIDGQKSDGENLSKVEESKSRVVDFPGTDTSAVHSTSLIDFHPEASLEAAVEMLEGSIAAPICSEKVIVEEKLECSDVSGLSQPVEKEQILPTSSLLQTDGITEPQLPEDELLFVASLEGGYSQTDNEKLLDKASESTPKSSHLGENKTKEVSKIKTEAAPVTVKKEKTPPASEKLQKKIPSKSAEKTKAPEPLKGYMKPTKSRGTMTTLPKSSPSDTEKPRHLNDIHLIQQRQDKAKPETAEPAAAAATENEKTSPPNKELPPSPEKKTKTSAATPSKTPLSKSKPTGAATAPSPKRALSATPTQKKSASPAPASTTTPKRPLSSASRVTSATPKDSKPKTLDLKSPVKSPDKKPAALKQTPTSATPRTSVKASPVASKSSTATTAAPTTGSTAPKAAVTPKRPTAPKIDVKAADVKRVPSTKSTIDASRPKSVPADLTKANGAAAAPTRPRTTKPAVPKTTGASSTAMEAKKLPTARTAPLAKPSTAPLSKTSTAPLKTAAAPKQPRPATVPDLKNIRSKIGSTDNIKHQPGGGKQVEKKPVPISTARKAVPPAVPKTATTTKSTDTKEAAQKQSNGKVQIVSKKVNYSHVQSKCGSKDNIKHVPGGGNVQILNKKIDLSKASAKCGSKPSMKNKPGAVETNTGNSKKQETAKETQEEIVKVVESQNIGEQDLPSQNGDLVTPSEVPRQESQENGVGERSPAEGDNQRESFNTLIPETSI
ncbi:microtubule associated protein 4 L homeolog isoform X4 [Xenopus laevis]|uniref:Microtubule-associated protein n=1 Tax=Xenopus laevis TaxID=8355 RepID=A0A8J1KYD9_XENLA|nr:microtubule associated protein 4 L homeolog isoform X4 [Xenopus laevis]